MSGSCHLGLDRWQRIVLAIRVAIQLCVRRQAFSGICGCSVRLFRAAAGLPRGNSEDLEICTIGGAVGPPRGDSPAPLAGDEHDIRGVVA